MHLETIRKKRQRKNQFQHDEKSLSFAKIVNNLAEKYVRKEIGNYEKLCFKIFVSNLLALGLSHSNQKKSDYS